MNTILAIVAYVLIFAACDVNRNEESKIKMFSGYWLIQLLLVMLAGILFQIAYR